MLKYGEPNPLNIFGLRRLEHCPPHFEKVYFQNRSNSETFANWIYENLQGRFYLGMSSDPAPGAAGVRPSLCLLAGFESPSEASYFSLFLPQINS